MFRIIANIKKLIGDVACGFTRPPDKMFIQSNCGFFTGPFPCLKQHHLVAGLTPSRPQLPWTFPGSSWLTAASCCPAHLVLGDLPGRRVHAKLLQRVDDLAPRADGDGTVEDEIQMVDAGILGAEEGGGGGDVSEARELKIPSKVKEHRRRGAQEAAG